MNIAFLHSFCPQRHQELPETIRTSPVFDTTVPFLDEIIMFVPIAYKIKRIFDISEFLGKYGIVLAVLLGIGIIALTVCLTIR